MEKLELVINRKVEIIWNKEAFNSNIQEVNDEFFSISIPTKDGEYIPLKMGEMAQVVYSQDLTIFEFDSLVLGRKFDGIPLITLEIPEKYTIVQRRQYFRVNKLDYIDINSFESGKVNGENSNAIENASKVLKNVVLLDLSGGGMKIKVQEQINKGDLIHFFLDTKKEKIELHGEVVRVERDEFNFYVCGICFLDLTQREREKIIQYTFEIMRGQRSKGL